MANSALADFRYFSGITESWELKQTGLVVLNGEMYKLELWHSYSNPDIPYYVSIHIQQDGIWRRMPDPPFPIALSGDEAMRTAMAFLAERQAA
ncbi:MAG: hypothetical protein L0Z53_08675 [Acidobacteriales bacterium]|nr:hypothetical protein [Terriglobales bacterium]